MLGHCLGLWSRVGGQELIRALAEWREEGKRVGKQMGCVCGHLAGHQVCLGCGDLEDRSDHHAPHRVLWGSLLTLCVCPRNYREGKLVPFVTTSRWQG